MKLIDKQSLKRVVIIVTRSAFKWTGRYLINSLYRNVSKEMRNNG